ncbi:MAG: RNA polymerase sigma factor [Mediterranea sp.]|jgi:RNA polymerase sigma-70 factor (ECF subfamily)|nr:RNA polymerase sigma factor [Mediterranea sp.]
MNIDQFKTVVLPLRDNLLRYARLFTHHVEDAEDAVQETMIRLWNRRDELERYQSIEAFATTLTRNICIDSWRGRHTTVDFTEALTEQASHETPEQLLEVEDELRLIHEIIETLPTLQRSILRLKDVEAYETDEIAAITGCTPEAIRKNLSRARKQVRQLYLNVVQEKSRRKLS